MITPIILSGGSGKRLWPVSRKSYPKQFVKLTGPLTLFQECASRMTGQLFDRPVIVTNSNFRFIVTEQLQEIGIDPGTILLEPESLNTAPAILAAALYMADREPEAVLLVAPSDHVIDDTELFHAAILQGLEAVKQGQLVTFGIKPSHAETGYGYLELAGGSTNGAAPLKSFIEKPNFSRATNMLAAGSFLWNSGIFLFSAKDIIAAFTAYAPNMVSAVTESVDTITNDLGFARLGPDAWRKADNISIDFAVMESANNISVVPFNGQWSDLGGWNAVWRQSQKDGQGVFASGRSTAIDCNNSLLRSDSEGLEIVGVGLNNIMAIAMDDAVLIADMSRSQDIGGVVDVLKAKNVSQSTLFNKDYRPWGWFESLVVGNYFQVKRIYVKLGAALSLQSHQHRSEHWVVVSGTASITVDSQTSELLENESIFIPVGAVHRLANNGKIPLILIEVQTGSYLGEDDIIRYEDKYLRGQEAEEL